MLKKEKMGGAGKAFMNNDRAKYKKNELKFMGGRERIPDLGGKGSEAKPER